ncbi:hypothetical protein GCM10025867_18360 [Frondihabitans sucicola]|uniref:AB hydrolase-1 domain-containing protein n=1 Tax=Frondihabitans sucicola TaxID=1268041 RepID=A0ABN6Y0X0_9MICO|nr:alpha/beta hydrolase [Frondihabitans sucicola]BDZ49595.1 hypothetical protein GCM10025867_18360 [Frondihabitans sucicola]
MKLTTRTVGSGSRTAALVHGASMSGDAWREFIPYLLEHDLTLTVVDLRGHGDSPRADSYRIDEFVGDLVDTLPQGLDLLIGQSLGGLTGAWASAQLKPKRFIGIDPAFSFERRELLLLRLLGPIQPKLPDVILHRFGMPPKGSPPDMMARIRAMWAKWDTSSVRDVVKSAAAKPFPASPRACRPPSCSPIPASRRHLPSRRPSGSRAGTSGSSPAGATTSTRRIRAVSPKCSGTSCRPIPSEIPNVARRVCSRERRARRAHQAVTARRSGDTVSFEPVSPPRARGQALVLMEPFTPFG